MKNTTEKNETINLLIREKTIVVFARFPGNMPDSCLISTIGLLA